jgi:transposase
MFVRKKKNKSGVISIQIIDKSQGVYKLVKTIGSSSNQEEVNRLFLKGRQEILNLHNQTILNFEHETEQAFLQTFYEGIETFLLVGPELLLGKLYDEIGFNAINDDLLRHLVIARLVYPVSKLKTVDYLFKYKGITIDVNKIYRYLDKIHNQQIQRIQDISYQHTMRIMGLQMNVVFYDVTTLYFEAEDEDDLRKTGFSKDGKSQQPQIVLGLLVSKGGYPLAYEIFEGNTFEGHTMLPVIDAFKEKYHLDKLVVVADAGLMSEKNIAALYQRGYQYIISARIKNETEQIKQQILALTLNDGQSAVLKKENDQRLIISFSDKRAKKDLYNRHKGLVKLEKALKSGKLSKKHINSKGYNKYLKLDGNIQISIDYEKFNADAKWDGLKGYLTNTSLKKEEVIDQYKQLWYVEKTFRISKSDLKIRLIYHYAKRRIEAHICIAFCACKIYKELERQLGITKAGISPEKAIDIVKTIYGISIVTPYSKDKHSRLLIKTKEQEKILKLFNLSWVSQ